MAVKKRSRFLWLSKLISRVLDPIVIMPVILSFSVWTAFVNGERIRFLLFLLGIDVILPGFVLYYFIQRDVINSGWDVRKREERIPLFIFMVLAHGISVAVAWYIGRQPLASYLASFWILTIIYALVTALWKISVHVGVISALATFLVLTEGPSYVWLYSLVLLMIWARVYGKYHRLSQALAGGLTPIVLLPVCFWFFGIL